MSSTVNLSLAQFVAQMGGICPTRGDVGEIARVREANKYLRGRNSIIRPGGTPADEILADARAEGFPVRHDNLLELLVQDAWGLIEKADKHRVYRDYVLTDADLDPFDEEPEENIMLFPNENPLCAACGRKWHLSGLLPTMKWTCEPCLEWYLRVVDWHQSASDPLRYERDQCTQVDVGALSWKHQEIMIDSLSGWLQ